MSLLSIVLVVLLVLVLVGGFGGPYFNPAMQHVYGFGNGGIGSRMFQTHACIGQS